MKSTFHHTLIALTNVDIEKIFTQTNFYNMRYKGAILILPEARDEINIPPYTDCPFAIVDIEKIFTQTNFYKMR